MQRLPFRTNHPLDKCLSEVAERLWMQLIPNPVLLAKGMNIGSISAETDDDFLFDCFVHNPAVELASRIQSPGMVLSGRTGSGKTAIIRHIERSGHPHVVSGAACQRDCYECARGDICVRRGLLNWIQMEWQHMGACTLRR